MNNDGLLRIGAGAAATAAVTQLVAGLLEQTAAARSTLLVVAKRWARIGGRAR